MKKFDSAVNNFLTSAIPDDVKKTLIDLIQLSGRGRKDIIVFSEEILGVPLNRFQKKFLKRTTTPREQWKDVFNDDIEDIGGMLFGKNIAYSGNQCGKTLMLAIKHIWMNFYKIGMDLDDKLIDTAYYSTLNLSPRTRQTKACYKYIKDIIEGDLLINDGEKKYLNKASPLMEGFYAGDNLTLGEIRFSNNSIMYSVPTGQDQASSLAGGQFAYISYDECSQSLHLQEELGAKIMSRLIKYGVGLDLISTPEVDSQSHQFYFNLCKTGREKKNGWWATGAILDDNRFIPEAQRMRIKADLFATDKQRYRQVVLGEFITGGRRFFEVAEIDKLWQLESKIDCIAGHKYLLASDWGMSDTGDESVFMIFDYTDFQNSGKIKLVNHEKIKGGSPQMQFAVLRTLYDQYTSHGVDGVTAIRPMFVMDAQALGGVLIKKLLIKLSPKAFNIEKDEALFMLKKEMSHGREFSESEFDGTIIEKNLDFGNISSYYIEELASQLGNYHLDDAKITQDFVMCLMMGISWIVKKIPKQAVRTELSPLAGYNNITRALNNRRANNMVLIK